MTEAKTIPKEYQCVTNCYLYKQKVCGYNFRKRQKFSYCHYPFPGAVTDEDEFLTFDEHEPTRLELERKKFYDWKSKDKELSKEDIDLRSLEATKHPEDYKELPRKVNYHMRTFKEIADAAFQKWFSILKEFDKLGVYEGVFKYFDERNCNYLVPADILYKYLKKNHLHLDESETRQLYDLAKDRVKERNRNKYKKLRK